jgi:sporulation protein YqfC
MREEKREGFKDRVYRTLDIQPDILPGGSFIEIRGRECVTVRGAGRILLYTPEEIRLERKGEVISVTGEKLICTSYHLGAVEIEGRVSSVSFVSEGENE